MIGLLGCEFCGIVTREDSLDDGRGGCAECGRPMQPISLRKGRAMVTARRRAEERRCAADAVSEVGLQAAVEA